MLRRASARSEKSRGQSRTEQRTPCVYSCCYRISRISYGAPSDVVELVVTVVSSVRFVQRAAGREKTRGAIAPCNVLRDHRSSRTAPLARGHGARWLHRYATDFRIFPPHRDGDPAR